MGSVNIIAYVDGVKIKGGATVEGIVVLIELGFLSGRSKLPGLPVRALLAV